MRNITALFLLGATTALPQRLAARPSSRAPLATLQVQVDSVRRLVIITAGPFHVVGMPGEMQPMSGMPGMAGAMPDDSAMGSMRDSVFRFAWPVDGWVYGCRIELVDSAGRPLPRDLLHHAGIVDFGRRELVYPMFERLLGVGKETGDLALPSNIGVPVPAGEPLALYVGLHDPRRGTVDGVRVRLTVLWTPRSAGAPLAVTPFFAEVNHRIGGTSAFDVPPGRSTWSSTFRMPVSGGLIAVGGHLHDYATSLTLVDAESGRTLVHLRANRAPDGTIRGLSRFVFGYNYDALRLVAGHSYRLVAVYDNPTGKVIEQGGMASVAGPFVPDDWSSMPRLDPGDSALASDLRSLGGR